MNNIGAYTFVVDDFYADQTGTLAWGALGRFLLNCSNSHSMKIGIGMGRYDNNFYMWVITRLIVNLNEPINKGQTIKMETWISKIYHSFINREYVIMDDDSKVIGTAFAVWALIDAKTRQTVNLVNMFGPDLELIVYGENNDLSFDKKRVKLSSSSEESSSLIVKFGDIDINQHMNSIRYIEHALDLFPSELYLHHFLNRIEVQYGQETSLNDHLTLINHKMDDRSIYVEFRKESEEQACKIRFYFNEYGINEEF